MALLRPSPASIVTTSRSTISGRPYSIRSMRVRARRRTSPRPALELAAFLVCAKAVGADLVHALVGVDAWHRGRAQAERHRHSYQHQADQQQEYRHLASSDLDVHDTFDRERPEDHE